jgi:hypothetical protein
VLGGAFNRAVRRVEATSFDGKARTLNLKQGGKREAGNSQVGDFRYVALAVRGPLCIERLTTFDAPGNELWAVELDELGREKSFELRSRRAALCPD